MFGLDHQEWLVCFIKNVWFVLCRMLSLFHKECLVCFIKDVWLVLCRKYHTCVSCITVVFPHSYQVLSPKNWRRAMFKPKQWFYRAFELRYILNHLHILCCRCEHVSSLLWFYQLLRITTYQQLILYRYTAH